MSEYTLTTPRDQQDDNRLMRTFTGKHVNPLELRPEDICIEDIAHHLSIINRYTGASPEPFSVAQHSVLGTWYYSSPTMKLAFLLHDAGEAYFNDISSPVKKDPRMKWYVDLEHDATKMIYQLFGLDPGYLSLTKPVDDRMFYREASNWWGAVRPGEQISCWPAHKAEHEFLQVFHRVMHEL